jgi:hypothetical protein
MIMTRTPAYMGCRTSAYGPVDMTLWPATVSMVDPRNCFLRTRTD